MVKEWDIYGSKRIGIIDTSLIVYAPPTAISYTITSAPPDTLITYDTTSIPDSTYAFVDSSSVTDTTVSSRIIATTASSIILPPSFDSSTTQYYEGQKQYELTNHLGNVLVTVSDKKLAVDTTTILNVAQYYMPEIINSEDFYPFGFEQPGRTYRILRDSLYRFNFNGKEKTDEIYGTAIGYDYGARFEDVRLGRFLSVDPIKGRFPMLSAYQFASNTPIWASDLDGNEAWLKTREWCEKDIGAYQEFVKSEIQTINNQLEESNGKDIKTHHDELYGEYNCADLAVALYVRYASQNGLEISFTNTQNTKEKISSSALTLGGVPIDFKKDPQKAVEQFEYYARQHTSAQSLVQLGDLVHVPFSEVQTGDIWDWYTNDITTNVDHVIVILYDNAQQRSILQPNNQVGTIQGGGGSSDNNDPMAGQTYLTPGISQPLLPFRQNQMYQFKELANASQNGDCQEDQTQPQEPSPAPPPIDNSCDGTGCTDGQE